MPKGYWVVFADVTDPEGYKGYMAANAKALANKIARMAWAMMARASVTSNPSRWRRKRDRAGQPA